MCTIEYIDKTGKRVSKEVSEEGNKRINYIRSSRVSNSFKIYVSYKRYGTLIYPKIKG